MKRKKFVPHRRQREQKTDYRRRLVLLKSGLPRIVVRRSLRNVLVQAIKYQPDGDQTLFGVSTLALEKFGWKGHARNLPGGYLIGYLFGKRAKESNIGRGTFDIGSYPARKGTLVYSVLKGLIDAGVDIPHDASVFPSDDRITGKQMSEEKAKMFALVKMNIEKGEANA